MINTKKSLLTLLALSFTTAAIQAAERVDLSKESSMQFFTHSKLQATHLATGTPISSDMHELSRSTDTNGNLHIRLQQSYQKIPVVGAEITMHVPAGATQNFALNHMKQAPHVRMTGYIYRNLAVDLGAPPRDLNDAHRKNKALRYITDHYTQPGYVALNARSKPVIFVDKTNTAHFAYQVTFIRAKSHGVSSNPTYIIDARNAKIYAHWDSVRNSYSGHTRNVSAGGLGGNEKSGPYYYDGLIGHESSFNVTRELEKQKCYLDNKFVMIRDARTPTENIVSFSCKTQLASHNNLYWLADENNLITSDATNGAYSPSTDAYHSVIAVTQMFQQWYDENIWTSVYTDKPIKLSALAHINTPASAAGNASCCVYTENSTTMHLGDGSDYFYPLTTQDIVAHESGHNFTEHHGELYLSPQGAALHESFSDMTAKTVQYFVSGTNDWQIGKYLFKNVDRALRYMNNPTFDCETRSPGNSCSIDNMRDYTDMIEPHHAAGITNKAFYLLATTPDWNTRKAFDVFVQANRYYWTPTTDFIHAACFAVSAANDLSYDSDAVGTAFTAVGLDTKTQCG